MDYYDIVNHLVDHPLGDIALLPLPLPESSEPNQAMAVLLHSLQVILPCV